MGGAAPESGGKGKRKSLDAPINLVPYIDLMTTIITFLMMTAVWTRIAALEVQNASGGNPPEEEEEDKDRPKPIIVLLTDKALKVQEEGSEMREFPITGEDYDFKALSDQLKLLKEARPERVEVKIQAEDGVQYAPVAKVIDISMGLELTGITLTPASAN
jgi:biopolymer transport protein TolR